MWLVRRMLTVRRTRTTEFLSASRTSPNPVRVGIPFQQSESMQVETCERTQLSRSIQETAGLTSLRMSGMKEAMLLMLRTW